MKAEDKLVKCSNCGVSYLVDKHTYIVNDYHFHNKDCRSDFHSRTLSARQHLIFLYLYKSDSRKGYTGPAIGKQLGFTRGAANKYLRELASKGFVRKEADKWFVGREVEFWIRRKD